MGWMEAVDTVPVEGVGVEGRYFHRSNIRFIGQLVDHHPVLVLTDNTDLRSEQKRHQSPLDAQLLGSDVRCFSPQAHLSLHLPARDGRLSVVPRFKLQCDGS